MANSTIPATGVAIATSLTTIISSSFLIKSSRRSLKKSAAIDAMTLVANEGNTFAMLFGSRRSEMLVSDIFS